MSIIRSSVVGDNLNIEEEPVHKGNFILDLVSSTFYTVIGYVCLDIVFAISLHYVAKHNTED
jgi:MATE family multidrug resistance protein